MTVITRDLSHETPDWVVLPGRHCGQICVDPVCSVCGEFVKRPAAKIPANIELGGRGD